MGEEVERNKKEVEGEDSSTDTIH